MAKRWLIVAACVPAVVVAGAVVAALAFDPNGQKDRVAAAVQRATGRTLTIAGPIRLAWGLTPTLEAEDVSFANMPGGTRPQMAAVARAEARVRLLPLLTGQVELASVTLVRPDILLETDAGGHGNWQFERAPPAATAGPSTGRRSPPPLLDSLRIEAGRLTWHDGVTGRTVVADVPHATLDAGSGPAQLVAEAQAAGVAIKLDATLGTAAQLTGAAPGPWPIRMNAAVGDATLALEGMADPAARTLQGRLEASVPDLRRLGEVLGRPGLPPLRAIRLAATVPAGGTTPQDVTLQVGASDLGGVLPGATLNRLALTWPAGQAARLEADGALGPAPWRLTAGMVPAGQGVALRGLSLASPLGDLAGDLAVTAAPRWAVRGTVVSTRIDADAIRALRPAAAPAAPVAPPVPAAAPAPATNGAVFSDVALPWARLRLADADLQADVGTLRLFGTELRTVSGHLALADGVLRLGPASFVPPEGRVDLTASLDARADAPPVAVALRAGAFALGPLLQAFGLPGGSDGSAEIDLALHAAGASPHALAATLDGHAGLALVDGEIANAALILLLGDVLRSAGAAGLDPGGRSHVRCVALRADASSGQVTLAALKLDTARLSLDGGGGVNLGDETWALHLRPLLRLGGAGVSAPVRVTGPLRAPAVALDPAAGTGRVGVVIGGLAGAPDTCAAELAAARDGRAGPLPVADAGKPARPADLLRGLLR